MGKLPRKIAYIHDRRNRYNTFRKRYAGLLKKIHELSVLSQVEVNFYVKDPADGRVRMFSSSDQMFYPDYSIIKKEDRKGPKDMQHHYDKVKKSANRLAHSETQLATSESLSAINLTSLGQRPSSRERGSGSEPLPPMHRSFTAWHGAVAGANSLQPNLRLKKLYRRISPNLARCKTFLAFLSAPLQVLI